MLHRISRITEGGNGTICFASMFECTLNITRFQQQQQQQQQKVIRGRCDIRPIITWVIA